MATPIKPQAQIIKAPSLESPHKNNKKVFLAGSTTGNNETNTQDWRTQLVASLKAQPRLTIYDPVRPDWDETWREDISCAKFREQTEWELQKQEAADLVVVYFHPSTKAPVSLLEFGLCAARGGGKVVVVCPEGYWKRGNVQVVCERFGVRMVEGLAEVRECVLGLLGK